MTDLLTAATPRELIPAGRHPGRVVAGRIARKAARSGALWGLIFAIFVFIQMRAYTSDYPTQASRDQLQRAFATNMGLNALIGPVHDDTVTGFAAWRFLGILGVLGAVWGLLLSTRLLRGEEEAGRHELLLAGQTTRRGAFGQSVAGLGAGLGALFAVTAIGTVLTGRSAAVGFTLGQSLYFALTLVAGATLFLAIGALASQLAGTRRQAAAMAGVVFGVFFALRMAADANSGLHWMVWLSPLGWIEQSRPLTDPDPLVLLPVLALIIVAGTVAAYLAGTRDADAATLAARDCAPPHLTLLNGPTGLALRLIRPVAAGWLCAITAFAVLLGSIAESSTQDSSGSVSVTQDLGRLGAHGSLVQEYLGLTFILIALLIALVAAGQITAIRAEEGDGRLENLVVRPLSRTSWFAGRLALAALVLLAAGLLAGLAAWAGAAGWHNAVGLGSLMAAGLNVVPPAMFLLGLGALGLGAWPRCTSAAVYGYLAWSFLIELTGAVVHADHWLMDTSIFFHMVPSPAANPDWAGAAMMAGLALAAALAGGALLHRRDLLRA